jgi:predicted TIM-barrel fold metal-dependent hydrolase
MICATSIACWQPSPVIDRLTEAKNTGRQSLAFLFAQRKGAEDGWSLLHRTGAICAILRRPYPPTVTMTDATPEPPLIDTHAHVYRTDLPQTGTAWHRPSAHALTEDYIATLDKAGVLFGVIAAASIYGDYNDYTLDAVRRFKRLRATVIVKPDADPCALRRMKDDGVVGIRFQFRNVTSRPDLASYEYRRLLRRVADLDWHVHLHDDAHRLPDYIDTLLASGPRLVIDHLGRPDPQQGVESKGFQAVLRAVDHGCTWVKISGGFRLAPPDSASTIVAKLLETAGPQRLLWGSDWPFAAFEDRITYAGVLNDYYRYVPDAGTRNAIDRTALAFYFS